MKYDVGSERHLVAGIFVIVALMVALFFKGLYTPAPPAPPPEPIAFEDPCRVPVTTSCEVVIEREFEDCTSEQRVNDAMAALLVDPQKSDVCKETQLTLSQRCPSGCTVDFSTLFSLPGQVQTDLLTRTESGCLVRGKRVVNLRATCATPPRRPETTGPSETAAP